MKVLVLGSAGIIGQHMVESCPDGIQAVYARRSDADLTSAGAMDWLVRSVSPDVVVNLAGESNTDTVERDPAGFEFINTHMPANLAWLSCTRPRPFRVIHISTQAVFSGNEAPYSPESPRNPINMYGRQKAAAESAVLCFPRVTVIRPTFVLGIRPDPTIGRQNPIEQMLSGQRKQVSDRFFSPSFAPDVARVIWSEVTSPSGRLIIHAGRPVSTSRYDIARFMDLDVEPVSHDSFPGIAARPFDTTYAVGDHFMTFEEGIADCLRRWEAREAVTA